MQFDHLTTAVFSEALELVEERQALELKLAKVNADLSALQIGQAPEPAKRKPVKSAPIKAKAPKRAAPSIQARPGPIKDRVIAVLKAADSSGVAVTDVAATLQIVPANLHVWFSTAGKKDPSIHKVGRGRYAWKEAESVEEAVKAKKPASRIIAVEEQPAIDAEDPVVEQEAPVESISKETEPVASASVVEEQPAVAIEPLVEEMSTQPVADESEMPAPSPSPENIEQQELVITGSEKSSAEHLA